MNLIWSMDCQLSIPVDKWQFNNGLHIVSFGYWMDTQWAMDTNTVHILLGCQFVIFQFQVSAEKSRVDSHGREAVQVLRLPVPVHSAKQPQDTHEGGPQEGAAQVGIIYA